MTIKREEALVQLTWIRDLEMQPHKQTYRTIQCTNTLTTVRLENLSGAPRWFSEGMQQCQWRHVNRSESCDGSKLSSPGRLSGDASQSLHICVRVQLYDHFKANFRKSAHAKIFFRWNLISLTDTTSFPSIDSVFSSPRLSILLRRISTIRQVHIC